MKILAKVFSRQLIIAVAGGPEGLVHILYIYIYRIETGHNEDFFANISISLVSATFPDLDILPENWYDYLATIIDDD